MRTDQSFANHQRRTAALGLLLTPHDLGGPLVAIGDPEALAAIPREQMELRDGGHLHLDTKDGWVLLARLEVGNDGGPFVSVTGSRTGAPVQIALGGSGHLALEANEPVGLLSVPNGLLAVGTPASIDRCQSELRSRPVLGDPVEFLDDASIVLVRVRSGPPAVVGGRSAEAAGYLSLLSVLVLPDGEVP